MTTLKQARDRAGLTALELGKRAEIGENRLYQLERERFPPRLSEASRLSVVLGIPACRLFPNLITSPRVKI